MKTGLTALVYCFLTFSPSAWAQEVTGVMMVVKGDVKVTSAKDGKTDAAKIGRKVFPGDSIAAGPDSRAKIVMSDKNILNISPDSKVVIEKYTNDAKSDSRSVELKVEYGKVRATVEQKYDGEKNKFNIRTPTAVAGVRGTDFITGFNRANRQTTVVTFSGAVAVGKLGAGGRILNPVFVMPGQQTSIGEGKPPEPPKAMPKEELNHMNNDSAGGPVQGENRSPASAEGGPAPSTGNVSSEPPKDEGPRAPASSSAPPPPALFDPAKDSPGAQPALVPQSSGIGLTTPPPAPPKIREIPRINQKTQTTITLQPE